MKWIPILFLFTMSCAAAQDDQPGKSEWRQTVLKNKDLQMDNHSGFLKIDTIAGTQTVHIFERTIGRMEVDAGYMERLWIESSSDSRYILSENSENVFYEKICRCENAGFHLVDYANLKWNVKGSGVQVSGYIITGGNRIDF